MLLESPRPAPAPRASGARLVPAAPDLWRVLRPDGRILGHLQRVDSARGVRYRARRYHLPTRAFLELGEFWSADDAVQCLRFLR